MKASMSKLTQHTLTYLLVSIAVMVAGCVAPASQSGSTSPVITLTGTVTNESVVTQMTSTPSEPTNAPTAAFTPSPDNTLPAQLPLYKVSDYSPSGPVAFSPDGKLLAFLDGGVGLLDLMTDNVLWHFDPPDTDVGPAGQLAERAVAFSPDGSTVATGGNEEIIYVLDASNGQPFKTQKHSDVILGLGFASGGKHLVAVSCGENPGLTIWDWQGETSSAVRLPYSACSITISPDTATLAIPQFGVTLLDADTNSSTILYREILCQSAAFSPDGQTLAIVVDNELRLWDLNANTEIEWPEWQDYQTDIRTVTFSSTNRLAILSTDGTITVWNMSDKAIVGLSQLSGAEYLTFSPDGSLLASVGFRQVRAPLTIWAIPNQP